MLKTRLVAAAAAIAVVTTLARAGAPCDGEATPVPVRLMTLNVKEGIGAPGTSTALAIGSFCTINDVDGPGPNSGIAPDIVCLQECDQANFAHLSSFRDTYLPGYEIRTASGDGFNFNAILISPAYTIVSYQNLSTSGPRNAVKVRLSIPGADEDLIVYCSHFKAFTDAGSVAERTAEANQLGQRAYADLQAGGAHVVTLGDYNGHSTNTAIDASVAGVFTHSTLGVPTGLKNIAPEAIAGQGIGGPALIATYPSLNSRLDYVCMDAELAAVFDTDSNGSFSQNEANSAGFVYWSGDDAGKLSNGNTTATSTASDHRPVVFNILLPGATGGVSCPGDLTGPTGKPDGVVDVDDLNVVLSSWSQSVSPCQGADVTGDGQVDVDDLNAVLGSWGVPCP
nr:hypothetical protein [uncultured bacterium]